jgi:hypothetical protein
MESRFKANIPEIILPHRSPDELQTAPREVLMNTQDYQLLSECLNARNRDLNSVLPKKMKPLKRIYLLGRHFEASPSKNGYVMIRLLDKEVAAAIQSIFSHTRRSTAGSPITEKFVKIQLFQPLSPTDSLRDLYRQFPLSGGHLYYNRLSTVSQVIPFDNIVVHFCQTPMIIKGIPQECLHVLPLPHT